MTIQDAVNFCNNHVGQAMDFDGAFGAQCVDWFNFYYQYITTINPYNDGYGVPGAKDIWNVPTNRFNKVANNPNDPNQLPPQGAILVYDGGLPGSGGYGHVAIVDSATQSGVTVWDQNWGGMYVHHQTHNWTGHEIGWLVFKGFENNITQEQLTQLYSELLLRQPDPDAINHYVGHYSYDFVKQDLLNSKEYAIVHAPKPEPTPPPEVLPELTNNVPEPSPIPAAPAPEPTPEPAPAPAPEPAPEPVPQPVPAETNIKKEVVAVLVALAALIGAMLARLLH